MTLEELMAMLKAKKEEIRAFIDAQKVEEAEAAVEEKRSLEKRIKILGELENDERRDLEKQKEMKNKATEEVIEVNEMRAIVKTVMGEEVTEEERAAIKTTDNSAVLPKQFVNDLIEIQKGYGALKGYCDVIPVFKESGTIPVIDLDQNEMEDVLEGEDIVDGTLVTTEIPFKVSKVGLIQTLTSELIEDAEVEIESLARKNFVNIATAKENHKILKVVKENATVIEGATNYEDVENAIDTSLPSVKSGLVTLTNVTGYALLKNQKDKQGRPLNLITVDADKKEYFHGKEIITVEDTLLPVSEEKTQVFYILNMEEAVKYCDRRAVTIARSAEAGFTTDTVKIRILERFGVVKGPTRSIKKVEF